MKNLIRNGGFERGTTDFWTAFDAKAFTADTTLPYKGTYNGKLVVNGGDKPYIMLNDYIPLTVGEIAYFECYLRSVDMFSVSIKAVYYDENLDEIETIVYDTVNPGTSAYAQIIVAISGIDGAAYVRPMIYMDDANDDRFVRIDNVSMYKFIPEEVMAFERLMIDVENIASAGTYYSDWLLVPAFKEGEFILWVDDCAGTSETVDVTIQSRLSFDGLDLDHDIATFTQVTSGVAQQVLIVTAGLGIKIRAKAVIGGSPTNVDVLVAGRFKR